MLSLTFFSDRATTRAGRGGHLAAACLLFALVGCSAATDAENAAEAPKTSANGWARIELLPRGADGQTIFAVSGLSAQELKLAAQLEEQQIARLLRVFVASELKSPPAILGTTVVEGESLRFTPRFELQPGMRYRAIFERAALKSTGADAAEPATDARIVAEFEIPARAAEAPTTVTRIYPSGHHLPENQLKFYIHFSAPMRRGEAYAHIHLLDADGREVEAPFLELTEELWDRDQRRFTLLCDPGRVKQELKPREELGPVLQQGKEYRLVIDRDWRDAHGNLLAEGAEKAFDVGPPDVAPVDTASWKLEVPEAWTRKPLVVRFPEPLDHAMLERVVGILDANIRSVPGIIVIADQETRWEFTPAAPWNLGDYSLSIETTLEDLAGNSIERAFEVDVTQQAAGLQPSNASSSNSEPKSIMSRSSVFIPFRITPADDPPND